MNYFSSTIDIEPYRYERKAYIENLTSEDLYALLFLHPAGFLEVFTPRYVHSVYFDTPTNTFFQDAVAGLHTRYKIRARWYGNHESTLPHQPLLEVKKRTGLLIQKAHYPLSILSYPL